MLVSQATSASQATTQYSPTPSVERLVATAPTVAAQAASAWKATVQELKGQALVITLVFLVIWGAGSFSIALKVALLYTLANFVLIAVKKEGFQGVVQQLQDQNVTLARQLSELQLGRQTDRVVLDQVTHDKNALQARVDLATSERTTAFERAAVFKKANLRWATEHPKLEEIVRQLQQQNQQLAQDNARIRSLHQQAAQKCAQQEASVASMRSQEAVQRVQTSAASQDTDLRAQLQALTQIHSRRPPAQQNQIVAVHLQTLTSVQAYCNQQLTSLRHQIQALPQIKNARITAPLQAIVAYTKQQNAIINDLAHAIASGVSQ